MKLLRVNLTKGGHADQEVPEEVTRAFLGGRGIGAKILYDENAKGLNPLDPEGTGFTDLLPYQSAALA